MRINRIQNNVNFRKLLVYENRLNEYSDLVLKKYEKRLTNTKHVDVIIDSHGLAIKDKMTDVLQRIQSFSLFTQEKSVGINMSASKGESRTYKAGYKTLEEAKTAWQILCKTFQNGDLESYAKLAIYLDEHFANIKGRNRI